MELKYYLRGLGLGIVVTALVMGFALSGKEPMTDEEVRARAKQLGMIEDTVLTKNDDEEKEETSQQEEVIESNQEETPVQDMPKIDAIQEKADEAGLDDTKSDDIVSDEAESDDIASENPELENSELDDDKTDEIRELPEDKQISEIEEEPEQTSRPEVSSGNDMTIIISSGDGSYTVSKKLADIGAVSSAESYDRFLCQNGYDKKIRTGTYVIPADASDEQMARIITGAE